MISELLRADTPNPPSPVPSDQLVLFPVVFLVAHPPSPAAVTGCSDCSSSRPSSKLTLPRKAHKFGIPTIIFPPVSFHPAATSCIQFSAMARTASKFLSGGTFVRGVTEDHSRSSLHWHRRLSLAAPCAGCTSGTPRLPPDPPSPTGSLTPAFSSSSSLRPLLQPPPSARFPCSSRPGPALPPPPDPCQPPQPQEASPPRSPPLPLPPGLSRRASAAARSPPQARRGPRRRRLPAPPPS